MTTGSNFRAASLLLILIAFTLPAMLIQWVLLKASLQCARTLPFWYHRCICRLLGIRLHVDGAIKHGQPVLIVANHVSWVDILVLSALAPVSFIAKSEIRGWPFVSSLAKLQRSLFINRKRKSDVSRISDAMTKRFNDGDILVLFAEGTTTDGNRVQPFRSALLSSAFPEEALKRKKIIDRNYAEPIVQTLSLVYTHVHGVPLGREGRKIIAWYGDMDIFSHAWQLLKIGPLDVNVSISSPVAVKEDQNRKKLALTAEKQVRTRVIDMLHGKKKATHNYYEN